MASLPPGWTADYDGRRWFFTYGPTGQSQFQFPRPGDEFPDLLFVCYYSGGTEATATAAAAPTELLLPEERRLEGERQEVRRGLDVGGGGAGSAGEGDGAHTGCFGNFAAVNLNSRRKGGRRGDDDGVRMLAATGVIDASRRPTGEPVLSAPVGDEGGNNAQLASSRHRDVGRGAAISIVGEPVLAVPPTGVMATASPPDRKEDEHNNKLSTVSLQPVAPPPGFLPMPGDVLPTEPAHTPPPPPWILPADRLLLPIPELYSESTALCEEEMNPPPVELPGDAGGWGYGGQTGVTTVAAWDPVELPAYEAPDVIMGSSRGDNSAAAPAAEPKSLAGDCAGPWKYGRGDAPGMPTRGCDCSGLPSQSVRKSPSRSLDKISVHQGVAALAPGHTEPSAGNTHHSAAARNAGPERRHLLAHFPSVLRPGPRRSGQHRPPAPVAPPACVTDDASRTTAADGRLPPEQARGQHRGEQVEARRVSSHQEEEELPARMPAVPAMTPPFPPRSRGPRGTAVPAAASSPEQPRQDRLPGPVNLVIPIRHMSGGGNDASLRGGPWHGSWMRGRGERLAEY
jgi:hypothetical protein